jgi:hypothetical protein
MGVKFIVPVFFSWIFEFSLDPYDFKVFGKQVFRVREAHQICLLFDFLQVGWGMETVVVAKNGGIDDCPWAMSLCY